MKYSDILLMDFIYDKNKLTSRGCIPEDINLISVEDIDNSYYVVYEIFNESYEINIDKLDLLGFIYLNGL